MVKFLPMCEYKKQIWLKSKENFLRKLRVGCSEDIFERGVEAWEIYKNWLEGRKDPNDFLPIEEFDVDKPARVLNDYQREILEDLKTNPKAYIHINNKDNSAYLELNTKLGLLKTYMDSEYTEAYATLARKNQIAPLEGTNNHWQMNWRGELVLKRALELAEFEEEELESLKGLGSFYNFNDVL